MTTPAEKMLDARVLDTARVLLAAIERARIPMTADQRVSEAAAARLIGMEPESLRNLRSKGGGPPCYRAPVGGHRRSYRVLDLAVWVESRRTRF